MQILMLLVPLALILSLFFLFSFVFANHRDQWEDLDTPAHTLLQDSDNQGEKT